jgi:excisionase family DNA binding protein
MSRLIEGGPVPEGELQLHSIDSARAMLGNIGKTWLYEQIKRRGIRVVKLGTRTLIPQSEVQRLVAECTAEASNDDGEAQA